MGLDLWHVKPSKNIAGHYDDFFTLAELNNPEYAHQSNEFISLVEDNDEKLTPGIRFSELGYQRKGMRPGFTKQFENCKPYFKLESVKMAFQFIQGIDAVDERELKENFQKYFIDNFEEGNSVFFASW